jgi:dihydrofolate synthase/folylpolyglutamate synthase
MPKPSLDRIRRVAEMLDDPQLTYPTVHITGTNGKTTTARLVTSLSCAHGLTTGTFISPHLQSVTERLSVCGSAISDEDFAEEYERLRPYLDSTEPLAGSVTYFEALTALAYVWFADKPVGLGVFEVGMGGTWDATNLIRSDVAVLCPVGLDHRELGSTVAEVATEKAGIVKVGTTAIVREQRPDAMAVVERRADEVGATLLLEGKDFALESRGLAVGGQALSIGAPQGSYRELFVPLYGEQAARNAAAAVAAVEALLGRSLDERAVREALRDTVSPGRLEVVGRRPLVVLDGAHNPDAMQALAAALREAFRWDRLHAVVGMFGDKDVEGALRHLSPLVDAAYVCRPATPRAADTDRVARALRAGGADEVEEAGTVEAALAAAVAAAAQGDLLLVTGSFYTVADARPRFVGASDPHSPTRGSS